MNAFESRVALFQQWNTKHLGILVLTDKAMVTGCADETMLTSCVDGLGFGFGKRLL